MEQVVVGERSHGIVIWQLAVGRDVHVEERVVEIERRVVERRLEHARGVQRADCEVS